MLGRVLIATALTALAIPAGAGAAQRFVAASGSGAACTEPAPCSIETGINGAGSGDEVIIAPGTYETSTPLATGASSVDIHGTRPGDLPLIRTSAPTGLGLSGFTSRVSDLRIVHTGSGLGVSLFAAGSTFKRISVHSGGDEAACAIGPGTVFRDSLCVASGDSAFAVSSDFTGPGSPSQFRNLTAIATGQNSIGLVVGSGQNTTDIVSVENSIISGDLVDARARNSGTGSTTILGLDHSNFDSSDTTGSNSVVSAPGSASNQTAEPLFTGGDRYLQAIDSPTVDAGIADAYTGSLDVDGDPRPLGAAMDIGSDELVPDTTPPRTKITARPSKRTRSHRARFEFESSEAGSGFRCTVDGKPSRPCKSPAKLRGLGLGRHRFSVAAVDASGNADPSPADYRWKVRPER